MNRLFSSVAAVSLSGAALAYQAGTTAAAPTEERVADNGKQPY